MKKGIASIQEQPETRKVKKKLAQTQCPAPKLDKWFLGVRKNYINPWGKIRLIRINQLSTSIWPEKKNALDDVGVGEPKDSWS